MSPIRIVVIHSLYIYRCILFKSMASIFYIDVLKIVNLWDLFSKMEGLDTPILENMTIVGYPYNILTDFSLGKVPRLIATIVDCLVWVSVLSC